MKETNLQKFNFKFSEDMPDQLLPEIVYIIGENKFYWSLIFICTCGCDDNIQLNLLKNVRPRWRFSIRKNLITISPSVRKKTGCKSHFIIRRSKVEKIKDWMESRSLYFRDEK